MAAMAAEHDTPKSIGDRLLAVGLQIDLEVVAYSAILLVAVVTRFHDLGTRVMSHDESLHTYFSWKLAEEGNFQHSPLMHGPLQFHLIALSYFLFGVTDATARIPAAVASVLAVGFLVLFRRWLGRLGALTAAGLMTVSPFMLYYGRYVRNEALVVAIGLLTFYAVFRYFEDRQARWLYLLAAALALHFTAKETAFIYTAQLMLFLGMLLSWRFLQARWDRPQLRVAFGVGLILVLVAVIIGGAGIFAENQLVSADQAETAQPADPSATGLTQQVGFHPAVTAALGLLLVGALVAAGAAVWSFGSRLRTEFPALDVLLVTATVTLPQLAAFPANVLGWDPLAYEDMAARLNTGIVLAVLLLIAAAIGIVWDYRRWLVAAGIFFGIFALFYTTVLTHPFGFFTGLVGSLGYWLEQHPVNRGSQPLYYYLLVQIPVYEFLPAAGALLAGAFGLRAWLAGEGGADRADEPAAESVEADPAARPSKAFPVLLFLGFWAITATVAYTVAGERMPWLTVHIALPYILLAGWSIGRVLEGVDWRAFVQDRGWAILLLGLVGLLGLGQALGYLLGANPPFAGSELDQLRATSGFLISAGVVVAAFISLVLTARGWSWQRVARLASLAVIGILFVLTLRTSFRAAFINYDRAKEFMVYAHSARGVKTVLGQLEELSLRTSDGMGIDVGYDDDVSWPFSWYLRDFTNNHYYASNPTRELLNYPVIITGDNNWSKVEPILGDRYYTFEYIRMWWPMQDYFDLTADRIWGALRSPEARVALWEIWFDREYTRYGQVTGKDFSLENWNPSDRMKLFIRKDMAALIWDYGVVPQTLEQGAFSDPYEQGTLDLGAVQVIGEEGSGPAQLLNPRGLAIGPDGSLYVADSGNHRIIKLGPDGQPLATWGALGGGEAGGPGLALNEPWGVATAPDGSLYVADTWNHRIHHLSAAGEVLETFGTYGEAQDLQSFWGPRDVAVDDRGRIFVADTGNKRVVYFDGPGDPVGSFGGPGVGPGQLDEPVGLAVSSDGRVYVADTWNQRVQAFEENDSGEYEPVLEWSIEGWYGQSLDNKPYLALSEQDSVCLSDPEGYRILCFDQDGEFLAAWGGLGTGPNQFGLPVGLDFQGDALWVVDKGNNRLMEFVPPVP